MVNSMSVLERINKLDASISAQARRLEDVRTTHVLKAADPIARLMGDTSAESVERHEKELAFLKAERAQLCRDAFFSLIAEKSRLEKALKEARSKATKQEWFKGLTDEEQVARLTEMRREVSALEKELESF